MVERTKQEIYETLQAKSFKVGTKIGQGKIINVRDVKTKTYGTKTVATISLKDKKVNIFLNMISLNNLIDCWGQEDTVWIDKLVNLNVEKDVIYNSPMIVVLPVA